MMTWKTFEKMSAQDQFEGKGQLNTLKLQHKAGIVGFSTRRRYLHSEKYELIRIEEVQIIQVWLSIRSLLKKARSLELKWMDDLYTVLHKLNSLKLEL